MKRVELDIKLRLDEDEPPTPGECTLAESIGGVPVVVVRDLQRVDELALGHLVAQLLINADIDLDCDAIHEFDRNRRLIAEAADLDVIEPPDNEGSGS